MTNKQYIAASVGLACVTVGLTIADAVRARRQKKAQEAFFAATDKYVDDINEFYDDLGRALDTAKFWLIMDENDML